MKFGIAFNEASGAASSVDGNDPGSKASPPKTRNHRRRTCVCDCSAQWLPIILGRIREIPEVCNIFCATANPVEVILAETSRGGEPGRDRWQRPKGIESANDREWRTAAA
jgi:adenosine/AMP kinase